MQAKTIKTYEMHKNNSKKRTNGTKISKNTVH